MAGITQLGGATARSCFEMTGMKMQLVQRGGVGLWFRGVTDVWESKSCIVETGDGRRA